ncbi:MAG: peptidoglycan DD-metalloendopeptidase family protein [Clostridia bacterium]|nr:peptidoglycan DD-metalloendopeptidase family protein [Clostridia bacterium]
MRTTKRMIALFVSVVLLFAMLPLGIITVNADDTWLWPIQTSLRMSRGYSSDHTALDIVPGSESSTPVLASRAGRVIAVFDGCKNWNGASGSGQGCDTVGCPNTNYMTYNGKKFCNYGIGRGVIIEHGDGYVSQYAHMESVSVSVGQTITKGQQLGYMGSRGASTGKHLHFEIRSGYTSGKNFWSCTAVNSNPYGDEYIVSGSWNGVDNIYYSRDYSGSHTHSYGSWQTVVEATCTVNGSRQRVCSCGDTQTESIPATGHSWNAGEVIVGAGCTDAGVKLFTCTKCTATRTEVLNAEGHSPVADGAVPATCTETGLTEGSPCSKCGAVITPQQVAPALGHSDRIVSVERGCEYVTVVYQCERCGETSNESSNDYLFSEWSDARPDDVDESMIEEKTQYSYRDRSTTYQDGNASLSGWTYTGAETIYGSWTNGGWTNNRPTETDTLRITDTRTVTDQAEYTVYTYYHYYGYASDGTLYTSYGNGVWKDYEEVSSTTEFPYYGPIDGYQAYKKSVSGKHGVYWWLASTSIVPAVTHTEWYYQTRSQTTRYYFEKWSDWSEWSDAVYGATENREVRTTTVYRYRVTPAGHIWRLEGQAEWKTDGDNHWRECGVCGEIADMANHVYDNDLDETCNICGYVRDIDVPIDPNAATLTVESKTAFVGKTITLSIDLSKNPGVAYLKLELDYDATAFELISAENAQLLQGTYTVSKALDVKPYIMQWMSADNSSGDGKIVTLTFNVKDDAAVGDYTIRLRVAEAFNAAFDDVAFNVENGMIQIMDVLIGDFNNDGVINGKDGILCSQALAGWDVVYAELAADVNGDGTFNGKDGILLSQYLAGWDVVLG